MSDQRDTPEFPFTVGEVVGWREYRCTIIRIPKNPTVGVSTPRVGLRHPTDNYLTWVPITELCDPPALAPHVQEAADEFAAWIGNPQSMFDGSE